MQDFPASELRVGYRLASGDTVVRVSPWGGDDLLIQVTTQNGSRFTSEYPADAMFFDVDTTFYDQMKEGAT